MNNWSLRFLVVAVLVLMTGPAQASRMFVPLDQAMEEATVIVLARVTFDPARRHRGGPEFVEFTVEKCWKGNPGTKGVCIDWSAGSSAAWGFNPEELNLLFLRPVAADVKLPTTRPAADVYYDVVDLKTVFDPAKREAMGKNEWQRAIYRRSSMHERHQLEAAQRMLDILCIEKPADPPATWRGILAKSENPVLLTYAAERLAEPLDALRLARPLSAEDANLLVQTVLRVPKERGAVWRIVSLLAMGKYQWDAAVLRQAIERGAPVTIAHAAINADNIAVLQEPIFARLTSPGEDYADYDMLRSLARYAPEFCKEKLRQGNYAFDVELPLLGALKINGSAVGRPDYPQAMFKANAAIVQQIGQMIRGETFGTFALEWAMERGDYRADWEALAPLLSPMLASADAPQRRVAAAFLRTLGYSVRRDGQRFIYDAAAPPSRVPVAVSITPPPGPLLLGQRWKAAYLQTAGEKPVTLISSGRKVRWRIRPADTSSANGETETSMWQGSWTTPSSQGVLQIAPGESAADEFDLGATLFKAAGRYRIILSVTYMDAGEAADVDAWTGTVNSEPIEVEVIAPR